MRLALYQPEIPQNTGALLRVGACLNVPIDIIEPCGFILSDRRLRRAGMDYIENVDYTRYESWEIFKEGLGGKRLILLTPEASIIYTYVDYLPDDILVVGRESTGFPQKIHEQVPFQVKIPMVSGQRSLNMAIAAAMVLGESLRQVKAFPVE